MNWDDMSEVQRHRTVQAMERFGGGFVARLSQALFVADSTNRERLTDAFPEMADKYGPGTFFYERIEEQYKERT